MNFIACDGTWSIGASGESICTGTTVSITGEELRAELNPGLSPEEVQSLTDSALYLFALVFVFLVLRKVL
jgi:hypothetical protein